MYQVTQEYIDKLYGVGKKRRVVSALLDGVPFNENDIIANSLKFTLQAVGGAEINLGGVFLGQLWLTFAKSFADTITRGTWKGKQINISIGLELSENVFEYIPIGVFTIDEANHTARGIEITAYDNMRKFDKTLDFTTMSGSLYTLASYVCEKCGVTLGMTREEIEALPNGGEVFSIYPDNDMTTYRDLVSWLSVTAGGFATMTRTGALQIRGWASEPVQVLGVNDRYAGGSFSDFVTYYTGLSVVNIADQTTTYISNPPDDGLTMNIGANPLIQYGLIDTKTRQLHAILDALENFEYTPFKVTAFADPFFDLGDVVQFNSGLAGTRSKCCIMRIDFSYAKGVTLQGFGKNPALFGAQSKTDKELSGISSHNNTNETKFQIYTNAQALSGATLEVTYANRLQIAELTFAVDRETAVEVNADVFFETLFTVEENDTNPVYRQFVLIFEIDGEEVSRYTKRDIFKDGKLYRTSASSTFVLPFYARDEIEHYFALLHMEAGTQKTLRVYLYFDYKKFTANGVSTTSAGSWKIDAGKIKIYLKGQGLSIEKPWDGLIVKTDEIPRIVIGGLFPEVFTDSALVSILETITQAKQDTLEPYGLQGLDLVEIAENLQITFTRPTRNIITEDGEFNITTEDGSFNLVTE